MTKTKAPETEAEAEAKYVTILQDGGEDAAALERQALGVDYVWPEPDRTDQEYRIALARVPIVGSATLPKVADAHFYSAPGDTVSRADLRGAWSELTSLRTSLGEAIVQIENLSQKLSNLNSAHQGTQNQLLELQARNLIADLTTKEVSLLVRTLNGIRTQPPNVRMDLLSRINASHEFEAASEQSEFLAVLADRWAKKNKLELPKLGIELLSNLLLQGVRNVLTNAVVNASGWPLDGYLDKQPSQRHRE